LVLLNINLVIKLTLLNKLKYNKKKNDTCVVFLKVVSLVSIDFAIQFFAFLMNMLAWKYDRITNKKINFDFIIINFKFIIAGICCIAITENSWD